MLWIVITSPSFSDGEALFISRMLAHGVDLVHLRKPGATENDCAGLLDSLTGDERRRIVIHDFFGLAEPYGLRGIHLNSRHNEIPAGYTGHISRSCHSLDEVRDCKDRYSYVFLSPIFDSVSKQGYNAAFTPEVLAGASASGLIDNKVVALGGVTPDRLGYLDSLGFGGAAMLGHVTGIANLPVPEQISRLEDIRMQFSLTGRQPASDGIRHLTASGI